MARRKPGSATLTPEAWQAEKENQVAWLRQLRKDNGGKIPGLELARSAALLDRTERQMRRYVDEGDPDPPPRHVLLEFTERFILLAYGYGGRLLQLYNDLVAEGIPLPSYSTFWRAWNRLPTEVKAYPTEGIKAHRRLRLYTSWCARSRNAVWQADVCKLDIWIVPEGCTRPIRPHLIAVIDDFSRLIVGWMITLAQPTAEQVRAVVAAAMLRKDRDGHWYGGKPDAVRWDNGMEFLAKLMTMLAMALRFDAYAVAPYSPMSKGKIERFFRAFQTWTLMSLRGYSKGPRTTDKTDVFFGSVDELLSEEPLIARAQERIDFYNFKRPHRKLRGMTPYEKWCSDPTALTEVSRPAVRAFLLPATATPRVFTTLGVQVKNEHYICLDLPDGEHESDLINQQVTVRGVPHDPTSLEVFDIAGRWLCTVRPDSSFTAEERARHGMRRDRDRRIADQRLKSAGALRATAGVQVDPETGEIVTIVAAALAQDAAPALEQPEEHMGQLFVFPAMVKTPEEVIDADRLQRPQPATPRVPGPMLEGMPLDA